MISKSLLAATVATGLVFPAQAELYVSPKPAIIKPENIEFSKHMLLGMPITMGMLAKMAAAANIEFVGYASASAAGAMSLTSLTGGIGSAPATGDIVIVGLKSSATSDLNLSITSPAGYTEIADIYGNDSFDTNLGVYYKVQGSTPDTSITVPSITSPVAIAYVLRNVNSTTPLDATATTAVDADASKPNPPAITTVTNNAVVVAIGANVTLQTGHTYPSGYSNYAANTGGLQFSMKLIATAGVENPAAYSVGYSNKPNESCCAVTLALRPA